MTIYDFDQASPRRHTDSVKWNRYPEEVLPLWVADMDFPSPPDVADAIRARLLHPIFGYSRDDPQLLEIICEWVFVQYSWKIKPEWILLMPGVVTGMNWVAKSFLEPGDRLCFNTPVYPPFFQLSESTGAAIVEIPMIEKNSKFSIDFDAFERILGQSINIFVLCNPHNPVGRVFRRDELETISEICLRKNVLICSDEIHCDLIYSGFRHIPIATISPETAHNTITLLSPSKTFNIPGLHFSYAVVPNQSLREQMQKSRGLISCPSVLANEAVKAVYTKSSDWLIQLIEYLENNRNYLIEFLTSNIPEMKIPEMQGTFLAWLDCRDLKLDSDPYTFFLNHANVALNNGEDFGINGKGFVRLNFACPRTILSDALNRMAKSIKSK